MCHTEFASFGLRQFYQPDKRQAEALQRHRPLREGGRDNDSALVAPVDIHYKLPLFGPL
eukprot:COSAG04_NODE_21193_length_378_cov_0.917563_1_plen_58_part_10